MRRLACATAVLLLAACGGSAARPDLQHQLDALVAAGYAPGVTAYVDGPHGSWSGAAGFANLATRERMRPDARLRLQSVSKLWTATVVVALAHEGRLRLDDTVERWLPGLFPGGSRITIRELLNHTSGLIDNNDLSARPGYWFGRIHDAKLRARLAALATKLGADPSHVFSDELEIRAAAALPLLFPPGTSWHYSNIGYKLAAAIAERASGETMAQLYRRIVVEPLHLESAAYDPAGGVRGEHPSAYAFQRGRWRPAGTEGTGALGAEGGIVADARDEARFLVALVRGELVPTRDLFRTSGANASYALGTGVNETCAGRTYAHGGAGVAWKSEVAVSADGSRVAVLLWNGRDARHDDDYAAALLRLFCAA